MAVKELPDADILRQLLKYNPETGEFIWLPRSASFFSDGFRTAQGNANLWNKRYAGHTALGAVNPRGYRFGNIFGTNYMAHRIAWKMATGTDPEYIDHIDGDTGNNQLANLRSVTTLVNGKNRRKREDNWSGTTGVVWTGCKHRPWRASIGVAGKIVYLGAFACESAAISARLAAEAKFGFVSRP